MALRGRRDPKLILAWMALIGALGVGAFLRLDALERRPMHVDEAVQAYKTGELLETGRYRYDPDEFHGPTLYYLTLPVLWAKGARSFAETTEWQYRILPVLFGLLLIAVLPLLAGGLGRWEMFWAGAWTAVSPMMVFYSRFYVQEMLLVWFTLAAMAFGWRWWRSRRVVWAVGAGVALGLMHATKETWVIALVSLTAALILTARLTRQSNENAKESQWGPRAHWAWGIGAAVAVSVVLHSSFFTHPRGIVDSILTYGHYLERSSGEGSAALHRHPWHYYLEMTIWTREGPGPWWSEGLVVLLALTGAIAAWVRRASGRGRHFHLFLSAYTLPMWLIYSAIPYKTPWTMLGLWHGTLLLAGVGAVAILRWVKTRAGAVAITALLLAGAAHLGAQAWDATHRFDTDPRNPYVYAHSVHDVKRLGERIGAIATLHPEGLEMPIQVIATPSDYWPLPWYLRAHRHVGYWDRMPESIDEPVIVAALDHQEALDSRLMAEYRMEYFGLRPDVLLAVYIRSDLWERFVERIEREALKQN